MSNSNTHKKISLHAIATCVQPNFGIQATVASIAAIQAFDPFEWSASDVIDILSELEISAKEIAVKDFLKRQDLATSQVIYLITFTDSAYVVQFDFQTNEKVIVPVDGSSNVTMFGLIKLIKKNISEASIFECGFKSKPKSSLLPFLDSHWFWSGFLRNSTNYIKSSLAVLLKNVFAFGTSIFSEAISKRKIPNNSIVISKINTHKEISTHLFWSGLLKNSNNYIKSGFAVLLTNVFALGALMFSKMTSKRIMPNDTIVINNSNTHKKITSYSFWSGLLKNSNNYIKSGFAVLLTNVSALGTSIYSKVASKRIMPSDTIDIDNSSAHKKISSHSIAACVLSNFGIQTSVAGIAAIQAVNPYEWSTADIIDTFSELEISAKEISIEDLRSRKSMPTSQVIYLITLTDSAYVVQFDLQTNDKVIVPVDVSPDKTIFGLIKLVKKNNSSATIFECSFKSEPKSSLLPFLDSHWFWSGILKNSNNYLKSGFAVLLTNVFALGTSMFSMVVYNRIIPANAIESLYALVFGMGLLLAVDFMTRQIRGEFLSVASNYADTAISDKLFEQIVDLKRGNRKITFSSVSSALKEFEQMREFFTSAGVVGLIDIPFAIIFLIAMWIIGQWMVLPVILVILVMVIHALISQPRLSALSKKAFAQSQTKNQVIFETLLGLEEIKLSNSGGFMRKRFNEATRQQVLVTDQSKSSANLSSSLAFTLQQVTQISVVAIGAILVHDGKYGYGAIIACTILSGKALAPFVQLSQMLNKLSQINTSYKSLTELMAEAREHPTKKEFFPIKNLNGKIEFDSVFFKYSGQSSYALENISIKIAPGEKIAILGRLGSGKTTLGRLITQLYEAEKGSIYLDGIDIRQISPSDIRRHVGMCTQQQWLLTETIEKNISLGRFDISGEDIRQAAYISCLSEFINQYPDGYKHVIEDRGESLSGGQRQAICLARALCKRPTMLILDEPTNSFDNATESLFIERFSQQEIEGTLILITHRLALLKLVDRIIIVDKGKIVKDIPKADFLKSGNIARAETKPAVRVN